MEAELYQDKAPISVKNFLSYIEKGHYKGTIFHRVIDNFMIQGGGFDKDLKEKSTGAPIKNEAGNGLKNEVGTLAMARTNEVDSATAQFFINVADNSFLDHRDNSPMGFGYAVFGKVTKGMPVVNKIKSVKTGSRMPLEDVPLEPVVILDITKKK
jgi:cyclophilin family peptidyl-prolyl cis-trans isomerase